VNDLSISVVSSAPDLYAAAPTIVLRLRLTAPEAEPVHAMVLRAQIRIEPKLRRYSGDEGELLVELFGDAPRWGDSMRPFLWTHVSTTTAEFTGSTEIDLPVPCSYDFEVAANKYLHSLRDGEIPVVLLFNGTIFSYRDGGLIVQPVPWHCEASHRLPVSVWRAAMDAFFPNSGWIRLRTDTIDSLTKYKADLALASWDDTFERLLKEADRG
jgi:hypothetical protein